MSNDFPNLQVNVSPLSNRIFAGYSRPVKGKPGVVEWKKKQDITKQAIDAVIRHLMDNKDDIRWEFVNDEDVVFMTIKRRPKRPAKAGG